MLETILALLPKVNSVVAALPEFIALIEAVKDTLGEKDQAVLQTAYDLKREGSDQAHAELQALVDKYV